MAAIATFLALTPVLYAQSFEAHAEAFPDFQAMQDELIPFGWDIEVDQPVIDSYYRRCTAGIPAMHVAGFVETNEYQVAIHKFWRTDTASAGTILLFHGYLAHVAQLHGLIHRLLQENFLVVGVELPGHGLSSGRRGDIGDFSDYSGVVRDVLQVVLPNITDRPDVIAHSTGASAVIEYLQQEPDVFRTIVFAAPLVRIYAQGLAAVGRWLSRPFLTQLKSGFSGPLAVPKMPVTWFDAAAQWSKRVEQYGQLARPLVVVQGTKDRVVAWRQNQTILKDLFPNTVYRLVEGASHQILQHAGPERDKAFRLVLQALAAGAQ